MTLRYWTLIVLLALAWGSSFFFTEVLLREMGPLSIALGRVGLGALGCWVWMILRGLDWRIEPRLLALMAVFSLLQYALPLALYPVMQQYITSSAAGIVNAMTPVMLVIVSHFWPGGENATLAKGVGVLFGFAGIVVLALPALMGQGQSNPLALIATMAAPLCYAMAFNLLHNFNKLDLVVLTAWSLTLATLFLGPVAIGVEGLPGALSIASLLSLSIYGFVLTSAAFILLFWLIPRVGGVTASTITLLAPVSAVLLGVFVLGETLLPIQLIGIVVIFVGLLFIDGRLAAWFRRSEKKHQPNG